MALLSFHPFGIYCEAADVYIDPWKPVPKALITHAHADHAYAGHGQYVAQEDSVPILRHRLGQDISVRGEPYGKCFSIGGVRFSFHPAGHVRGSAQIRAEHRGEIWVVSGDYKRQSDPFTPDFEPLPCHHFVTEATFALPVYRWPNPAEVALEMRHWWEDNARQGLSSVVGSYSLGKAQRVIHMLREVPLPIFTHGAIAQTNTLLRDQGVNLPDTTYAAPHLGKADFKGALLLAPPAALNSAWMRRFKPYRTAFCSGWMSLRGPRRRRAADRGFILSDHADWPALNQTVRETGAENIYVTHGYKDVYARYLREEMGLNAVPVDTLYEGESIDEPES